MKYVSPVVVLAVLCCGSLCAADFQGADAVLKRLAEVRAKAPGTAQPASPLADLRTKLTAFRTEAAALPPDQAAARWLALFDAYAALPLETRSEPGNWNDRLTAQTFLHELPPPADWDALGKAVEARAGSGHALSDRVLAVLVATLRGDAAGRKQAFEGLRKAGAAAKLEDYEKQNFRMQMDQLAEALAAASGEGSESVALFEKRLAQMEKPDAGNPWSGRSMQGMVIPDLVKLAGREKATALIRRALVASVVQEVQGDATRRLAVSLALASVDKVNSPSWSLVDDVDDAPLYEALVKRFPDPSPIDTYQRDRAGAIYFISLIVHNRTKEAAALVAEKPDRFSLSMSHEMTEYLARKGLNRQVRDFLREALANDPALPFWSEFIEISARLGEADRALAFLREIVARPNLTTAAKDATNEHYVNALLAADQVEEGLGVLRKVVQTGPGAEALAAVGRKSQESTHDRLAQYGEQCLRLMRLGKLLDRVDLVNEGLAALAALPKPGPREYERQKVSRELLEFLVASGRGPEAEHLAVEEMIDGAATNPMRPETTARLGDLTKNLANIYHRTGRHEDVLKLLDASPYWRVPDLSFMAGEDDPSSAVLFAAAKALAVAGKKEDARRVLDRVLEQNSGYDPAYALLLELGGDGLPAHLDALAQRDRFQERPLIWKAKLQLNAGRVDEAEKTVRAAIAIDPSDGEEGKGDRMRAYAVLGDVLEKKGDAAQAKIMRGAVEAIRLSENADDWWQAGLLTRAVKMYEEALGHFADAYCIQSRLALRYSELGDYAKAEQHYQRAFELMPDSFGRIESHCFGCEGAFSGERAQGIAERVFGKLAAQPAAKAQVFYLLGYLRSQQQREADAAAQFLKAVKLDPDYFNAWEKLSEHPDEAEVPQEQTEAAVLAMLRLDPTFRHHGANFQKVRNLRGLWEALLAAEKAQPPENDGPIYPLTAAKAEIDRRAKIAREAGAVPGVPGLEIEEETTMFGRTRQSARMQFAQQPLLMTLANLLEMLTMRQ